MSDVGLDERVDQAVRNNAIWCDTVCQVHGRPGTFFDDIWVNQHVTPPFYPNVVTLSAAAVDDQYARLQTMVDTKLLDNGAVKDSFAALDLTGLGFQIAFEATWLWRVPDLPMPPTDIAGIEWRRITDASMLAVWEATWSGVPANETDAPFSRIFLPSLLNNTDVVFVAAFYEQQIVAGAIGNRTGNVVGISNVFVPGHDADRYWAGCVASIMDAFPGLPLVGYEHGEDLALAHAAGFDNIAPLRIWVTS